MSALPENVISWIGKPVVVVDNVLTAEAGLWHNFCAAVEDGNPQYWQGVDGMAPIAPPAMLPSWVIDHDWHPAMPAQKLRTLELHFMLKDALALPFGVVTDVELEFHQPVRAGDKLRAEQILIEVGDEYQTRMGPGRRWTIGVNYYQQNVGHGETLAGIQTLHFVSYRKEQI